MRGRAAAFLAASAACLIVLAGCGRAAGPAKGRARRVTVAYARFLSYAPLVIAEEAGFFREEGLDVEFRSINSTDGLSPLLTGRLDVLTGSTNAGIFNAAARGGRVAIVADKGYAPPSACTADGLLVREGMKLDAPGDLQGARFGYSPATLVEFEMDALLESLAIPRDAVRAMPIPSGNAVEAFRSGAIDVRHGAEPVITQAADAGVARLWKPLSEVVPNCQLAYVAFGPRLLDQDRDTGRRFIRAYLRGIRRFQEGKTERNVALVARFTGLSPDIVRRSCWESFHADGSIDLPSTDRFVAWGVRKGYIDRAVPSSKYWDGWFTRTAAAELAEGR